MPSSKTENGKYQQYPNPSQIEKYLGGAEHGIVQVMRNYYKYNHYDLEYVARQYGRIVCEKGGAKAGGGIGGIIGGTFGHLLGAAAGVLLGAIIGWGCKKLYKWLTKSNTTESKAFRQAMEFFDFSEDDIRNHNVFKLDELERRYHKLTKEYHPDRKTGSRAKWDELEKHHGILLALFNDGVQEKHGPRAITYR
eukprot:CAMPEP_0201580496 /NCGR_PEP_ID=MMETSP0190_2-20130828/48060_1 /ASSEMBLY_ACC=CAM_ASM_000263 /TAXON_ID=37353 /ORGANISM="Rosalina sp." /LENGTH=193 /DNA_ID=CAMNT_0048016661 /DNA_START=99 /DNA_END=677 /DNA_ORIENTATION=-